MIDHKPLIYAISQRTEKPCQRQQRQVSFIYQSTTNIEYLPVSDNVVADTLSRVENIRLPTETGLNELADAQADDRELKRLLEDPGCSLYFRRIQWGADHTSVYCDLMGETLRLFIPFNLRKRICNLFHEKAHPSANVTDRIIRKRYVWPSTHKNITNWCKSSTACQQ